jgi:hypothetical protein
MPAPSATGRSAAIAGALVLGAGVLMLFAWTSQNWLRVLIVLALFVAGIALSGYRLDYSGERTLTSLGDDVRGGISGSVTFVGAYLIGPLILSLYDSPPKPVVVILLVFGFPLLALLWFVSRGMPAGSVGAALLIPVLGAVLLAQAGVGAGTIAIVAVLVAVALLALVIAMPKHWELAQPVSVFGGTAASFAVGAGTASIGTLTAQQTNDAVPALPPAPQVVVLAVGLLAAVGFVLLALARHDVASGLVAGSVLAVPPTSMLIGYAGIHSSSGALAVLVAVPVICAVIAGVALFVPTTRRLLREALPPHRRPARPVVGASMLRATIGVALVVVAQAVPLLGHAYLAQGVVMTVLLAAAVMLACWVPGTSGAVLAGVVLVELGLDEPWWRLTGDWGARDPGLIVLSVIGLVVTVAVAVLLLRKHRLPGVFAAASYALASVLAILLAAIVNHSANELSGALWLFGPLVLLGIPAAVAALSRRGPMLVTGQAVGCVMLAGGGFALARLLLPVSSTSAFVADTSLAPLIPTLTSVGGGLPGSGSIVAPVGALAMFVIAVPLLVSTVRRPSVPLTAAGLFVLVDGAAAALLGVAENWSESSVNLLIAVLVIIGVAGCGVAFALLRRQQVLLRRQDVRTPTAP